MINKNTSNKKLVKNKVNELNKKIILTGPPGGGKGILSGILKDEFNLPHIAMGDILRNQVEKKTKLGKQIEKAMNSGDLISDDVVNNLVEKRLVKKDVKKRFVLDGYPRHLEQAKFLLSKTKIDEIIVIKLSDKKIIERLKGRLVCPKCGTPYHLKNIPPKVKGICDKCGTKLIKRNDEDKIIHRLKLYHKETEPILKFYKKMNIKIKIIPGDFDVKTEKIKL